MIGQGEPPGEYVGHTGAGPGSTAAVYQRLVGRDAEARARCMGAAFAPRDDPGVVETEAMALACCGLADEVS